MSRADAFLQKAEKRKRAFFGGDQKYEEAAELFCKAANCFKLERNWREAGEAFEKAVECDLKRRSHLDAVNNLNEAANCYKKCSATDAIRCINQALEIQLENGQLHAAARHYKDLGELYESEANYTESVVNFERAAELFSAEEAQSTSVACKLKVASLCSIHQKEYLRAAEIFENIAITSLDNNLTHWSARENFLRAGICRLATGNIDQTREQIQRYQELDVTFNTTRECQLLTGVFAALEARDVEKFSATVFDFDSVYRLDSWKTTMLLAVKEQIVSPETSGPQWV